MSGYVSAGAWPAAADARPPALADGGAASPTRPPDVAGASELTLVIVGSSSSSQTVPDRVDRLMLARSLHDDPTKIIAHRTGVPQGPPNTDVANDLSHRTTEWAACRSARCRIHRASAVELWRRRGDRLIGGGGGRATLGRIDGGGGG